LGDFPLRTKEKGAGQRLLITFRCLALAGLRMKDKGTFDRIIDTMAFVAGILLVATVLIVCIEVCMRYFFHKPQVWTVEVCEYILFGIAFLGAPWLLKMGGHISVDVVTERLGSRSQGRLRLLSTGSGVLISAIICWFSLATAWDCFKSGVLVTKTLTLPKHYFLILIFIGYFFLLVEFASQFFQQLKELGEKQ
jgi:TRAP-type C4-dicarboxylate transport system permease small subunit